MGFGEDPLRDANAKDFALEGPREDQPLDPVFLRGVFRHGAREVVLLATVREFLPLGVAADFLSQTTAVLADGKARSVEGLRGHFKGLRHPRSALAEIEVPEGGGRHVLEAEAVALREHETPTFDARVDVDQLHATQVDVLAVFAVVRNAVALDVGIGVDVAKLKYGPTLPHFLPGGRTAAGAR